MCQKTVEWFINILIQALQYFEEETFISIFSHGEIDSDRYWEYPSQFL